MDKRYCKRCLIKDISEEEYHEMIEKHINILSDNDRCPKETYDERLNTCRECDRLNAGTCLSCGCYVEIRAAGKKASCPRKKW